MEKWKFVHVCDTQPGSPRSFRYRPAWIENQKTAYAQIQKLQPDLVLVGGDLTRDGTLHDFELEEAKANLDALQIPYHAIPGNMDVGNKVTHQQSPQPQRDDIAANMTSENLQRFARVFGEFPWSFVHRNVRFSGCYAAVAGSGLPQEKRFWEFLENLPSLPSAAHHVLMMHYALFINYPGEDSPKIDDLQRYHDWYFAISEPHRARIFEALQKARVEIVLSGHIHCRRPVQEFGGIRFYKAAATSFGQWENKWPDGDTTLGFFEFEVSARGIMETFVPLEKVSTRTDGYGPGGHPSPAERDYSLVWEKK
jgi:predicted MPP superfamily phosphohydrolase